MCLMQIYCEQNRLFQSKAVTLLKAESDELRVQRCERNFTFHKLDFSHNRYEFFIFFSTQTN